MTDWEGETKCNNTTINDNREDDDDKMGIRVGGEIKMGGVIVVEYIHI